MPLGKVIVKVTWTLVSYLLLGDSTCVLNLKMDHQLFQIERGRKFDRQTSEKDATVSFQLCYESLP